MNIVVALLVHAVSGSMLKHLCGGGLCYPFITYDPHVGGWFSQTHGLLVYSYYSVVFKAAVALTSYVS